MPTLFTPVSFITRVALAPSRSSYLLKEHTWFPPLSRRGGPLNSFAYSSQGFPVYSCQVTKDILRVFKK